MDWNILWWIVALLLIVGGLAGTILPALPGVPLIFAGIFVVAWVGDFEVIGWATLGVFAILSVVAWAIDFLASAAGTRYMSATPRAFWGAAIGALVGMFFGLPGLILGPFLGAVIGELSSGTGWRQSGRAGIGAWIGLIVATALKLAIAFVMIGIFLVRLGLAGFD
jgi:uncharacterized protein YqgC (DUF456 family)